MDIRLGALKLYRQHLLSQYADRCGLWSLKAASGDSFSGVLCIMTDGMDQAKFQLPRSPGLVSAYRTSKLVRPRLAIHGCWAFNVCLRVGVLDETHPHDSSTVLELLLQTIEDAVRIFKERGQKVPDTLVLVGDNTVRELKNQYVLSMCSNLTAHTKFRQAGI